jgi:hypothetical protein
MLDLPLLFLDHFLDCQTGFSRFLGRDVLAGADKEEFGVQEVEESRGVGVNELALLDERGG